jgi:hypothetical protein
LALLVATDLHRLAGSPHRLAVRGAALRQDSFGREPWPDQALLVNCDLPAAEDMVRDPQVFFRSRNAPSDFLQPNHER